PFCVTLLLAGLSAFAYSFSSPHSWGEGRVRGVEEPKGFDALRAAALGFAAWIAWHALVTAAAPPTSWDAVAYHLPLARAAAALPRIPDTPWMMHAHFPFGFELVYAGLLTLSDDRLPALLHAVCGLAAAGLAYSLLREEGSEGAALCAAAL